MTSNAPPGRMLPGEAPLAVHIAPSVLAADFAALGDEVARCARVRRVRSRCFLALSL